MSKSRNSATLRARMGSLAAKLSLTLLARTNSEGRHVFSNSYARDLCTTYESQFIQVGDYELHYQDVGDGPILVMLHGFGASLHVWNDWVEILRPHFRLIRIDLPGFGLSTPLRKKVNIDFFQKVLQDFLEAIKVEKYSLVGNSLGGWLAWEHAALNQKQVEKLVLLDAAGYFENSGKPKGIELIAKDQFRRLMRTGVPKMVIRSLAKTSYGDKRKLKEEFVNKAYVMANREGMLASIIYVASSDAISHIQRVGKIKTPTLILWGEKDKVISVAKADFFYSDLPNSQLKIYKGIGHVPMMEIPEESAQDLLNFMQ